MKRIVINPANIYQSIPFGFSHAAAYTGQTVELAGQVAWDSNGELVGKDDLITQTQQVLNNLQLVLAAVGATSANVVRLRTYVVNHSPEKLGLVCQEISNFYGKELPAPNTFIGVQSLALPELLIEIEATAVIQENSDVVL